MFRYLCKNVINYGSLYVIISESFSINFKFLSWNFIYLNIDSSSRINYFIFAKRKRLINPTFIQLELKLTRNINVSKFRKNKLKIGTWKNVFFQSKIHLSLVNFYFSYGINKCFNGGIILYPYHLLAIEKNGDSDDQSDQRNAITGEIYSRRDNLCTTLDRWLAKISTEAIVAIIAPDTVYPAPTTRVLWKQSEIDFY